MRIVALALALLPLEACGRIGYESVEESSGSLPSTQGELASPCEGDESCIAGLICGDARCAYPSSCAELRSRRPTSADGHYTLGGGPQGNELRVYCDMSQDGGGWTLVSEALIQEHRQREVTLRSESDSLGGLRVRLYANAFGCGTPAPEHLLLIQDRFPWTRIRFRQRFAGRVSCYAVFGASSGDVNASLNNASLARFEAMEDTIREEIGMSASGDAFTDPPALCVSEAHFWNDSRPPGFVRSARVILRRDPFVEPAGPYTTTGCADTGPGMTSPTWWEYDEIYIR